MESTKLILMKGEVPRIHEININESPTPQDYNININEGEGRPRDHKININEGEGPPHSVWGHCPEPTPPQCS